MSTKYTLASSTTAGDRLLHVGNAAVHLSTGDLVMLAYDPGATDPNKISLQLLPGPAHTTPALIATLSTNNFDISAGIPQALTLCRDSLDNLYVIGRIQPGITTSICAQAFTKGAGLTWTPQPFTGRATLGFNVAINGLAAVWCNTTGGTNGAGHIMVVANLLAPWSATFSHWWSLDAGYLLSGAAGGGAFVAKHGGASFLGACTAALSPSNIDIAPDGFGAASGIAANAGTATQVAIGAWGLTSSGVLTTGGGLLDTETAGTMTATTKIRCIRYAANRWAIIYNSTTTPTHLTCRLYSSSAMLSTVEVGIAGNFPANGATLSWDATSTGGVIYVYGWSSVTATTMLRVPITTTADVAAVLATVTDDTAVGAGTNTTVRAVTHPIDQQHVDWQSFNSTSPFSLLGDFSALPSAPLLPTLASPANAAVRDASTSGVLLSWVFNPGYSGDVQTAFYIRRFSAAGYQWWNGAAFTAAQAAPTGGNEVSVAGGAPSASIAAGNWTASTTYYWSVQTVGATGLLSGYTAPWLLYGAATPPTTPTLTAIYDAANNRVTLTVSGGTGSDTATVQYSDGGVNWFNVRNGTVTLTAGAATVYDYEAPPAAVRSYRVYQNDPTQAPYNANSTYSPSATATPTLSAYWLRPLDGTAGITVRIVAGTFTSTPRKDATVHYPLGTGGAAEQLAVVVSGDLHGLQGSMRLYIASQTDDPILEELLERQVPLLFQQPLLGQFYAFFTQDQGADTGSWSGWREHSVTFVEVARP